MESVLEPFLLKSRDVAFHRDFEKLNTQLSKNKTKIDSDVMQLISRKLPEERANRMIEPFLFTHLRKTRIIDYNDLLKEMERETDRESKTIKFILNNLVIYFIFYSC